MKIPMPDPDAIMRLELEGETLRQLGGVHAPALYDRPMLDDGRPVPGDGVRADADARPIGWRELRERHADRRARPARRCRCSTALKAVHAAGSGPPRPQAGEHLLDRPAAGDAHLRLRPGQAAGGHPAAGHDGRDVHGDAGVHGARAARLVGAGRSARRHLRDRRGASTRCSPGGRRSGGTPPRSSRRWPTGARRGRRATSPAHRPRSRTSSSAAWPRIRSAASRRPRSSRPRSRRRWPTRRASRFPWRAAPAPAPADAKAAAPRRPPSGRWPCWPFTASPSTR